MKRRIITACLMLLPLWANSQPVVPKDCLLVDGSEHVVRADLLFGYLRKHCTQEQLRAYMEDFIQPSGSVHTRYWKVEDNSLYLLKIENEDQAQYPLHLLFPEYKGAPILAEWVSGNVSYRLNNSPVIQLNHEYYEEEAVIRFMKGRVIKRYEVNHRERWLSYARRIMDYYRPLENTDVTISRKPVSDAKTRSILQKAFAIVTKPKDGQVEYNPVIRVDFDIDLGETPLNEFDVSLSAYGLLEAIAGEADAIVDVTLSNRFVTYTIRKDAAAP